MSGTPGTRVTLLRGADLVASPWKNGGGVTREIAAQPPASALDTFAWRVSVADVAQAGPFSRFEGVDRTLVLLEGAGMVLDEAGDSAVTHALTRPFDVACFAGEASIEARLVSGPTRDFNLMVRRGVARGTLEVWSTSASHRFESQTVLLYCAHGAVEVVVDDMSPVTLASGDTLRVDTSDASRVVNVSTQGEGVLLTIALDTDRPDAGAFSSDPASHNAATTS